jgi:hypothetical protein
MNFEAECVRICSLRILGNLRVSVTIFSVPAPKQEKASWFGLFYDELNRLYQRIRAISTQIM